jgi:ABC-2 type transport system ATP-binding protein
MKREKTKGHLVVKDEPADGVAIRVQNVSKSFVLPHNRQNSIKGGLINLFKGDRSYEVQEVLKDISFEIKKGEFFGIVGRNGSGKSTLLKMLAGIYTPSEGTITVNGSLTPFIELGVGFNPELTGRENVFLNGALLGFNRSEMAAMYDDIVEFAELERFMDQKLKNYSSGMQVRLAFSIAIRAQSDILLLDEVLAVGDANFQQKCYNYFENLRQNNRTLVFISHDMGAVKRFCTRASYIRDGQLLKIGNPQDIADMYTEDNILSESSGLETTTPTLTTKHSVSISDKGGDAEKHRILISYTSEDDNEMYVGFSVVHNGRSVAEITTDLNHPLLRKGSVTYILHKNIFNSGNYQISGVTLFQKKNRQVLAVAKHKVQVLIKGDDPQRGGAMKLEDTWLYER